MFDPLYILMVLLPGLVISGFASWMVKTAFNRYSQVPSRRGYSGAEAAQILLDQAGLHDVRVVPAQGFLTDHYNPLTKELALSEAVYSSSSVAAIGVATHEAGHALQQAQHYAPLWARSALVPVASIGSGLGYLVMVVGLMLASAHVVMLGAVLFGGRVAVPDRDAAGRVQCQRTREAVGCRGGHRLPGRARGHRSRVERRRR